MKVEIPQPVLIGILVVVVVAALGFGWYTINKPTPLRSELQGSKTAANGTGAKGQAKGQADGLVGNVSD